MDIAARPKLLLAFAVALTLPLVAPTAARGEATTPSVDGILDFFRTEAMLEDAAPEFNAAIARRKKEGPIAEIQQRQLESLGKRIYPAKNLLKIFKAAYTKAITLETMNGLHTWMNTLKGIQLRHGLNVAYGTKAKERLNYFDRNSAALLKPNRQNAIHTYINEWQLEQYFIELHSDMDYSVHMGLAGFQPVESRDPPARLKEQAIAHRTGFSAESRDATLKFEFYALKELKNAEVDELTTFGASPLGKAHTRAYLKAFDATLDAAAATLLQQVLKASQ